LPSKKNECCAHEKAKEKADQYPETHGNPAYEKRTYNGEDRPFDHPAKPRSEYLPTRRNPNENGEHYCNQITIAAVSGWAAVIQYQGWLWLHNSSVELQTLPSPT
jgi:hypothetical protein